MSKKNIHKRNISGKFPCDICGTFEFLEEHHIRGRKIKNANLPFNLTNICACCHYKVHLGEIILENWILSSLGRTLLWHKKDELSISGEDAKPHQVKNQSSLKDEDKKH